MAIEKVYAVFGLGSFGQEVCRVLARRRGKVIAFDNQPALIERIKDTVTQAYLLDTTDGDALKNAPLDDVDIAVVAIGNNIEASILTTALLKRMEVPYILARAVTELHLQVLQQVGADEVVNLEIEEGRRIALRLVATEILESIPLSKDISIAEFEASDFFIGKTLRQLDLQNRHGLNVIAVRRIKTEIDELGNPVNEEELVFVSGDEALRESDVLILVGRNHDLERLREL